MLDDDPELVRDYVEYVATESLIEQSCGLTFRDTQNHDLSLPVASAAVEEGVPAVNATDGSKATWLSRLVSHPVWAVAALMLIAATVGLGWLAEPPLSTIVAANDAQLANGRELHVGQLLGDRWIDLQRGSIRLAFQQGAMASIESPARFRVRDGNAAELAYGAINCQVSQSAHGFQLDNPSGRIVDLGTGFRAVASEAGALSVHVTQGAVQVGPSSGKSFRLQAGQIAELTSNGRRAVLSESRQQPTVRGQFLFMEEHPESLGYDEFVHDDLAYVFLESHSVRLPYNLRLDLAETGSHTSFLGSPRVIPAETIVDCYLIHCAPRKQRHKVEGTVTFSGKILGLLANDDRLNATNELLGASWTLSCQHPERGIESLPDENSDRLKISHDRRTLSGYFRTMSIDQVRVLVARE